MKKILIICVTFHSNKELQAFLESVHRAAERVKGQMMVDIQVADNGKANLGYLGGALPIYNRYAQDYDYVSISNVDLLLGPDFFEQLLQIDTKGLGWIAPDIYTDKIDRHENPYMLTRPTKYNFLIWNIIYSSTWIYRMYHSLYLLKNKQSKVYPACNIYAGHGSFMLFTKAFVEKNPEIHFICRAWIVHAVYQGVCRKESGDTFPGIYVRRRDLYGGISAQSKIESIILPDPAYC